MTIEHTDGMHEKVVKSIQATDTPQWEWSTAQCQEWFYAFLIEKFNYSPENALATSAKLEGFGPNIFSRRIHKWRELLGEEDGEGVYNWLLAVRHQKGAFPKNLRVLHGVSSKEDTKKVDNKALTGK